MFSKEVAISVSGLSKCYQIYDSPRDRLMQFLLPRLFRILSPVRKLLTYIRAGLPPADQPQHPPSFFNEFWALKDVSFDVGKGETVGIIGRNGSGKSTLLQMVCGTLHPTSGTIKTNGRIAALLELGAGFNPEFTGRENVYMNASVLGLSNAEIDERFDEIAAFADIGQFIEQPIKMYSSGMVVRLAFAVIAHVDADILVVDEALAVGDAVFTQKCMRYIRDFQKRGTLLFVSHDLGSVKNLCKTGIWLDHGVARMIGPSKDVAEAYLEYTLQETYGNNAKLNSVNAPKIKEGEHSPKTAIVPPAQIDDQSHVTVQQNIPEAKGWKTGVADLLSIQLARLDGSLEEALAGGEPVRVTIKAKANQELDNPILGFTVRDRLGQELFGENTLPFTDLNPVLAQAGQEFFAEFDFTLPMLPNGQYAVMASVANGTLYDHIQHHFLHDALILTVTSSKIRWGLVGIPFEKVTLKILNEQ